MNTEKNISFISDRKHYDIPESSILYVSMNKQDAFIHTSDVSVLKTRMTFAELNDTLSADFIRINRGCLVSAMAIHSVGKLIVKRRIAGIYHAAPQGDTGEIPCETAFCHRFACRQRQSR